jgi:tetratricopeptide (TPR) repeat protein
MKAMAHSAYREAVTCFEHALEALPWLPSNDKNLSVALDLHSRIRDCLFVLGDYELIRHYLKEAEKLSLLINDDEQLSWSLLQLASAAWQTGDLSKAIENATRTSEIAKGLGDSILEALACYRIGITEVSLGRYRTAAERLKLALSLLDNEDGRQLFQFGGFPYCFVCSFLTMALVELGDFDAAMSIGLAGNRHAEAMGQAYSQTAMSFGLGQMYLYLEQFAQAIAVLERGMELAEINEIEATVPWMAARLAFAYAAAGREEAARHILARFEGPSGWPRHVVDANPSMWLARACLALGDAVAADELVAELRSRSNYQKEAGIYAWCMWISSELQRHAGDIQAATNALQEALDKAENLDMKPLIAYCRLSTAHLKHLQGLHREAKAAFLNAAEYAQSIGMTAFADRARREAH